MATRTGFKAGAATVTLEDKVSRGARQIWDVVRVRTGTSTVEVYISPSGRSVTVYKNGERL